MNPREITSQALLQALLQALREVLLQALRQPARGLFAIDSVSALSARRVGDTPGNGRASEALPLQGRWLRRNGVVKRVGAEGGCHLQGTHLCFGECSYIHFTRAGLRNQATGRRATTTWTSVVEVLVELHLLYGNLSQTAGLNTVGVEKGRHRSHQPSQFRRLK